MELVVILVIGYLVTVFVGAMVAFSAMGRTTDLRSRLEALTTRLAKAELTVRDLQRDLAVAAPKPVAEAGQETPPAPEPAPVPVVIETEPVVPAEPTAPTAVPAEPPRVSPLRQIIEPPVRSPWAGATTGRETTTATSAVSPAVVAPMTTSAATVAEATTASTASAVPGDGAEAAPRPRTRSGSGERDWARFEEIIGRRWMTWVGVLILFIAGACFVHYGFTHGLIGPGMRLVLGLVTAIGLGVAGEHLRRRDLHGLSQGLTGLGIMLAYASLFGGFAFSDTRVINQGTAFAGMLAVTAAAIALSLRVNAMSIALLGTIGGLLTPILLSTGGGSREGLCAYLIILDLGVLGAALWRRWRILDVTAFIGTAILVGAWAAKAGTVEVRSLATAAWALAFWAVFALVAIAYRLRWRSRLPPESYLLAASNAVLGLVAIGAILHDRPAWWFAGDLVIAALYLVVALRAKTWFDGDVLARSGYSALAIMAVTASVPVLWSGSPLVAAWLVEAVLLWWLAGRHRFVPLAIYGSVVGVLAVGVATVGALVGDPDGPAALRDLGAGFLVPVAAAAVAGLALRSGLGDWTTAGSRLALVVFAWWPMGRLAWFLFRRDDLALSRPEVAAVCAIAAAAWSVVVGFPRGLGEREVRAGHAFGLAIVALVVALIAGPVALATGAPPPYLNLLAAAQVCALAALGWSRYLRRGSLPDATVLAVVLAGVNHLQACFGLHHGWSAETVHAIGAIGHAVVAALLVWRGQARAGVGLLIVASAAMLIAQACGWTHDAALPMATVAGLLIAGVWAWAAVSVQDQRSSTVLAVVASLHLAVVLHLDLLRRLGPGSDRLDFDHPHLLAAWIWVAVAVACTVLRRPWTTVLLRIAVVVLGVVSLVAYAAPIAPARPLLHPAFVVGLITLGFGILDQRRGGPLALRWILVGWAFALATFEAAEAAALLSSDRHLRLLGMSAAWSILAFALLGLGFAARDRGLRLAGIALFGLTVGKLVVFDLSHLRDLARIGSFCVAGVLLLGGSWLYQRLERGLRGQKGDPIVQDEEVPPPEA